MCCSSYIISVAKIQKYVQGCKIHYVLVFPILIYTNFIAQLTE